MNLEIDEKLLAETIGNRVADALLANQQLIDRIVDSIIQRFEALTPFEAAKFLDVTTRTLGENHVKWGLDKSTALGTQNPRYFLSQIIAALKAKKENGSMVVQEKLGIAA